MNTIRKIARPCGITGGIWAILVAVFYSLFLPAHFVTKTIGGQSWGFTSSVTETWAWATAAIIILTLLMGILGLLAVALRSRNQRLSRIFIWVSALATLVISLISGLLLLPAAIMLILAAIGMKETEVMPFQEAT